MERNLFDHENVFDRSCSLFEGYDPDENEHIRINYIDAHPSNDSKESSGVVLLIHGFPQTSHQFRKVLPLFTKAGYRVIAPDYRGAGDSSRPVNIRGYRKSVLAADLHHVIQQDLQITIPIHVVGHDIGGMIAHAYAVQYPSDTASVCWGECPLPGTTLYEEQESVQLWHFVFHRITDLPEALVAGKERAYITHFYDKLAYNRAGITSADVDLYEKAYAAPGAMRAGMNAYRMFNDDAKENVEKREKDGKPKVKRLALNGGKGMFAVMAKGMVSELYENFQVTEVDRSGHWIAEENPIGYVEAVLKIVKKD